MRQQENLTDAEWNFFLRGSAGLEKVPLSSLGGLVDMNMLWQIDHLTNMKS